ncbi:LysE family transporter [Paenibacillus sp. JX-17]|uniref:LysE family transporter n=1 Tax=Paenibacillus lacisoli TaxID=3064525 RepID=A0ABT9C6G6_9BACL|nr:LysE family transporter [Paenibacillus sp. JX-17]MDO7904852.1 LysE family transporter [Paenibacillus sp. JX-17]
MYHLISYMLLGITLSAPIGPVNAAQLDKGIKHGFLHAWIFGLGAAAADVMYMILVYFGVIHFLNTPFIQTLLWLFGAFILIYSGIESIWNSGRPEVKDQRNHESLIKSCSAGFIVSAVNPMSVLFWLGIYGSVLADMASGSFQMVLLNSAAILAGILLWDLSLAVTASSFRRFLTDRIIRGIAIVSGIFLIGFGVYFGTEAVQMMISRL